LKIIEAVWEKRNLGVSSREVIIEKTDTIHDLKSFLKSIRGQEYVVIKVPSGGNLFLNYLTDHGFYFVEALSELYLRTDDFIMPKDILEFDKLLTYKLLPKENLEFLGTEIRKGIFNTDRIAIDTHYGISVAATRYYNWVKDEIANGNYVYEVIYKEKNIGFFAIKRIGLNSYDIFLAGMYVGKEVFGFGFSVITKAIEETILMEGKYLISHVSSNNLPIIRLHIQLGFMLNSLSYVMVRHFN